MVEIVNQKNNDVKRQILKETMKKFDSMPLKEMKNRTVSKAQEIHKLDLTSGGKESMSANCKNHCEGNTIEM